VNYENTDTVGRIWQFLPLASGETVTVALEPGEKVKLNLDESFDDCWLKPVPVKETISKKKEQSE
jgi:hypothetical protein